MASITVAPELHFINRITYGATAPWLSSVQANGWEAVLESQLDVSQIDDSALEAEVLGLVPTTAMSTVQLAQDRGARLGASRELVGATILRRAFSPKQLYERMVEFWSDHFNVSVHVGAVSFLKTAEDRDVIRPRALASFNELLHANAKSAAMLFYLDNYRSVRTGPNENYARELLELHTLGVNGGYSEADVREVARCLTGWTISPTNGGFMFRPEAHDDGEKVVLGNVIAAGGGVTDGERVVDILSEHPSTARRLATKLAKRFVHDEPPESLVAAMADTFLASGGDIPSVLRSMFHDPAFWMSSLAKLKRPADLVVSMVRTLEFDLGENILEFMIKRLESLGQLPLSHPSPEGYSDDSSDWLSASAMLDRWNTMSGPSYAVPSERIVDWLGSASTPRQILHAISESRLLMQMSSAERAAVLDSIFAPRDPDAPLAVGVVDYSRLVLVAVLCSRYFQMY